jgi:CubicO group peptidase (beta-lactamase class C family)
MLRHRHGSRFALLIAAILCVAPAQAQQSIGTPAETDPAKLGWMQGSPPSLEKRIAASDGNTRQWPQIRWAFAHMRELLPTARLSRGNGRTSVLPVALRQDLDAVTFTPLGRSEPMRWDQAVEAVYADAILVLHKGRIVQERYFGVMNPDQTHLAMSVTKSYVGTLTEMLIGEGKIDETALVSRYVPELARSGFGDATVRQVLDMTTAIDYSEDYNDPAASVVKYAYASGMRPAPADYSGPRAIYDYLPTLTKKGTHGEAFTYRTVNTEVLGWIIARVTGKRPDFVLSERIWSRLGSEHDADIVIDSAGTPAFGSGLNLTLRDMARFGEAMRLNGRYNGQQIIPASVVAGIRAGASKPDFARAGYRTLPGWSYRSQWWVSHNPHGAYMARGIHGQAIYIDPKAEMVIVRFASNPRAGNANFDDISLPAYQAIAERLMRR